MVITISSMKGGSGKSTVAIMTANCLAARGFKVLVVDLDTNNSSTMYYTTGMENIENTVQVSNVFEALTHRKSLDYIIPTKVANVDLLASSINLCDIRSISHFLLKSILPVDEYDHIVIDTPPVYDNHTMSALYAADIILTPLEFNSRNFTTSSYLQAKILDELPDQYGKWYQIFARWEEYLSKYENSMQNQFTNLFLSNFDNILDVKIPKTDYILKYMETYQTVSITSNHTGSRRLANAFNELVTVLTGDNKIAEVF